uniref:Interferon-induced protein with tetratricopeptide repeats 9 n=1 Tax=Cyprinus carpio TaxID=7962 RepID=A0A8C1RYQ2_CYPCA
SPCSVNNKDMETDSMIGSDFFPQKYHATYFSLLAFISHLEDKTESALDYLQKAESALKEDQRKKAKFLVTFSSFAWVHYHLQRLNDVEDYLNKVKSICKDIPGSSDYFCSLPVVHGEKDWSLLRLGGTFYEQAKESFSKALEAEPDNMLSNVSYAIVLYRIDSMNKADNKGTVTEQLRKALSLEPTNTEIMVLLALKLQRSRSQEAQNLIKKAFRLSPDIPQVTRYVAKYFKAEGSIKESLSVLTRSVKQAPNSSTICTIKTGLCHKQLFIQMLEERRPERIVPAAQKVAMVAECKQHFSKAVELKPNNIYAKVNLAEGSLIDDKALGESEKQHCYTSYGVFLLYKKKDEDIAVSQFKSAYMIPVDSYERQQTGKKLRLTVERNLNTKQKFREAFEILAFISSEDKQEMQAKEYLRTKIYHTDVLDKVSASLQLQHFFFFL